MTPVFAVPSATPAYRCDMPTGTFIDDIHDPGERSTERRRVAGALERLDASADRDARSSTAIGARSRVDLGSIAISAIVPARRLERQPPRELRRMTRRRLRL
jgi:hypothetical protein